LKNLQISLSSVLLRFACEEESPSGEDRRFPLSSDDFFEVLFALADLRRLRLSSSSSEELSESEDLLPSESSARLLPLRFEVVLSFPEIREESS